MTWRGCCGSGWVTIGSGHSSASAGGWPCRRTSLEGSACPCLHARSRGTSAPLLRPAPRTRHQLGRRAGVLLLTAALLAQAVAALIPVAAIASSVDQGVTAPVAPAAPTPSVSVALDPGTTSGTYTGFNASATSPNPQNLTAAGASDWRIWGRTDHVADRR